MARRKFEDIADHLENIIFHELQEPIFSVVDMTREQYGNLVFELVEVIECHLESRGFLSDGSDQEPALIKLVSGDVVVCAVHDRPLEDNSPNWLCDGGDNDTVHYLWIDFYEEDEPTSDYGVVKEDPVIRVRQATDAEREEFGWT